MPSVAALVAALPQVWLLTAALAASQPPPFSLPLVPPLVPPPAPLRGLAQLKADVARLDQRADQLERFGALRAVGARGGTSHGAAPLIEVAAPKRQPSQAAGASPMRAASPERHGGESPLSAPASMALLAGQWLAAWACGDVSSAVDGSSGGGGGACGNSTSTARRGSDGVARTATTTTLVAYAALDLFGLVCLCWLAWRAWSPSPGEGSADRDYRHGVGLLVLGAVALANLGVIQDMVETLCVYAWLGGVAFFFASGYLQTKFGHTARTVQAEVRAIGQGVRAIHSVVALAESGVAKIEGRAVQAEDDVLDALGLSEDSDEAAPGGPPPAARPKSRWNNWRCGC